MFEGVTRSMGVIIIYSIGAFISWHQIAFVGLIFPLIALLLLLNSPESPVYLVSKGKMDEAENSLKRLNHGSEDVSKDLKDILASLEKCKETNSSTKNKWELVKNLNAHPEIYKPFFIITFLRLVFGYDFAFGYSIIS